MDYRLENLTEEDAEYVGEKINEIVPHEVDADKEVFVLKVENETGGIIGGCIAEACKYHWSRMFPATLLGTGLAEVDIKDHIKSSFLYVWAFSILCMIFANLVGIMPL